MHFAIVQIIIIAIIHVIYEVPNALGTEEENKNLEM